MCPFPLKWGVSQLSTTHGSWDIEIPFFGIFWNSEINMKCNSFIPEIGGSVQVGVFFIMFPYPSSFIPKRPPSHLGGPQSGRGQFLTLGILFELINYSWNFNLGTSENFFWLVCEDIPKCDSHTKIYQNWSNIYGYKDLTLFGQINKFNIHQFLCLPLFLEVGHLGGNDLGDQSISSIPSD